MSGRYDFRLKQGSTHKFELTWKMDSFTPVNLTGFTARMQIRANNYLGPVFAEMTSENGLIEITEGLGVINVTIPANQSEGLFSEKYVYDIEMVKDDFVELILEGKIKVSPNVTRGVRT